MAHRIPIIAFEFSHAMAAAWVLRLQRNQWNYIQHVHDIYGYSECEVILVDAKRFRPTRRQSEDRYWMNEIIAARRMRVKVIELK